MNRKIKFRVWNEKRKCMMFYIEAMDGDNLLAVDEQGGFIGPAEWKTMVFMQYTGLKDVSDKEIYEMDILVVKVPHDGDGRVWDNSTQRAIPFIIKWDDKRKGFDLPARVKYTPSHYEVIGNVFENPELLKQEEGLK